jgi:molecular chaperone DnaK (HSP70)
MQTKPTIYTEENVKEILASMLKEAEDQENDTVSFKELFTKRKIGQQRFSEWAEKFKECEEISESLGRLKDIYETKLFKQGLFNKMNANLVKFGLSANYGWKDKTEVDQNLKGELNVSGIKIIDA